MKILNYDEVITTIEKKHNINVRNYINSNYLEMNVSDEDYIPHLDFWGWICDTFKLLDDPNFTQDKLNTSLFIINFANGILIHTDKYEKNIQFYESTQHHCSMALYKIINSFDGNPLEAQSQIVQDLFKKFKKCRYRDIKQEKAESDPAWVVEIIALIDNEFGEYRDEFGSYCFSFDDD